MEKAQVTRDGPPRDPRDIENEIAKISGAAAIRIVDAPGALVNEHSHDWPILSLFVTGAYTKFSEVGETVVSSPGAVLHAPGAPHGSRVGRNGAEQIDIEFDPAWVGLDMRNLPAVQCWIGGRAAAAARGLAALWISGCSDEGLLAARTRRLLELGLSPRSTRMPHWLGWVKEMLRSENPLSTAEIAKVLGLHPGWLAHQYRQATGEGMGETIRRHRVERASALLRSNVGSHAQIALDAGFCDQSHMIRSFRAVLGRTPLRLSREMALSEQMHGIERR